MEKNIEGKLDLKDKLFHFYNSNKKKFYFLLIFLILSTFIIGFIKYKNDKDNIFVAEKYIKANLYLSSDKKNDAIKLYEEIIKSKNNFYSILALNTVVEKKLITNEKKILDYFNILENSISSNEHKDLTELKKALYLLKIEETQKANILLENLIEKNSKLKSIAQLLLEK